MGELNVTPITVKESPVTQAKQNRNLTGNVRLVRDYVADIYNLTKEWDEKTINGLSTLKTIVDKKSEAKTMDSVSNEIQQLFCKMEDLLKDLGTILQQLKERTLMLEAINQLQHRSTNPQEEKDEPLFLTWPSVKFVETSKEIQTMYDKEYRWKCKTIELLGTCHDENTLVFYTTGWLHQPYIEKYVSSLLEGMLRETGLSTNNL